LFGWWLMLIYYERKVGLLRETNCWLVTRKTNRAPKLALPRVPRVLRGYCGGAYCARRPARVSVRKKLKMLINFCMKKFAPFFPKG
jgi:hypothetical protein